jgi:putative membrane protein
MLHTTADSLIPPAGVAVPLAAAAWLYVRGLARTNARRPRIITFVAGWTALGIALATPLHDAGGRWLSMHMLQHMLLMNVAAPLLVWSRPGGVLLRGLPTSARAPAIRMVRSLRRPYVVATGLAAAFALHLVILWAWHAPPLYDRTLSSTLIHDAQHVTLLGAALLFWTSVEPALKRRALSGAAVFSLFVTTLHTSMLAALLTFSSVVWYAPYAWSDRALQDQQLAGLIMWVPGALPYVIAALAVVWNALSETQPARAAATVHADVR